MTNTAYDIHADADQVRTYHTGPNLGIHRDVKTLDALIDGLTAARIQAFGPREREEGQLDFNIPVELGLAKARIVELEARVAELEAELTPLRNDLHAAQSNEDSATELLTKLRETEAKLTEENAALRHTCEQIQRRFDHTADKLVVETNMHAATASNLRRTNTELDTMRADAIALRTAIVLADRLTTELLDRIDTDD